RKAEIAGRQEQIVKLLEDQKATLEAQIERNRVLMDREKKLIGEEEAIATARAKLSEEGRRLLEREKQLLLQEQTGRTPGPMAAQAPGSRPAVTPAPASTPPRPPPLGGPPHAT